MVSLSMASRIAGNGQIFGSLNWPWLMAQLIAAFYACVLVFTFEVFVMRKFGVLRQSMPLKLAGGSSVGAQGSSSSSGKATWPAFAGQLLPSLNPSLLRVPRMCSLEKVAPAQAVASWARQRFQAASLHLEAWKRRNEMGFGRLSPEALGLGSERALGQDGKRPSTQKLPEEL